MAAHRSLIHCGAGPACAARAADSGSCVLATVIEMKFEGEPRQVLGAGYVLIDDYP